MKKAKKKVTVNEAQFTSSNSHLLANMLSISVPLRIQEILRGPGYPTVEDWRLAHEVGEVIAEQGDNLIYPGPKKGESADLFNRVAHALAVMSFVQGGVEFAGTRYEAETYRKILEENFIAAKTSFRFAVWLWDSPKISPWKGLTSEEWRWGPYPTYPDMPVSRPYRTKERARIAGELVGGEFMGYVE